MGSFGRWSLTCLLGASLWVGVCPLHGQEIETSASQVRLERMLLLLKPSEAQRQALDALLKAQQTPGNSSFHQWLTSSEFADQFALPAADAGAVTAWLRAQGFAVAALPAGRGWMEFSGTAGQVQRAFGAAVEATTGPGGMRYALVGTAQMPAALTGKVEGLVSLDGSLAAAAVTPVVELKTGVAALAAAKSAAKAEAITPALASAWLRDASAKNAMGAGESIVIPARSNVRAEDFAAFRAAFGLPAATLNVVPNGVDPARTNEEAAAIEAVSWAGAAAPGAQIVLAPAASTNATDGLDLALAAAVDGALGQVISVGYAACESGMSAAHQAFYAALYRQAAAEGISVVAASGDSGAAGCHAAGDASPVASGYAVNGLASTPWNTAVGAVATQPEATGPAGAAALAGWEPAAAADAAYATGGGSSQRYALPLWQSAVGVPTVDPELAGKAPDAGTAVTTRHRYLPDVSLPAGAATSGSKGLAFCYSGETAQSGCRLVSAGGSGVSAAIFSGIAAVLAEKYGAQGNLAPNLYALRRVGQGAAASQAAQAFVDVTDGAARLFCTAGSAGCGAAAGDSAAAPQGRMGFAAGTGYDLASGLGSVNATALVENWASPEATGTATSTVEMTTVGGVTYNPSAVIVLSAKVISGSGGTVPTGTIQFYDETTSGNTGSPVTLAADGTASYSEQGEFTNGGHNIQAQYSGDSTYAAAESQPVTINVQPSATALVVAPSTTTPAGGATITVTGTVTATNAGAVAPTGTLTVNLDGIAQGTATLTAAGSTTASMNSGSVKVTVPTGGSHTVQGTYSGDSNYNNSTSPSVTITVAKTASVTAIAATPSVLSAGVPETFTATVAPATAVTGTTYTLTGSVSFYDNGTTLLGTAVVNSDTAVLSGIVLSASATHAVTAVYSGDSTYDTSTSSPVVLAATLLPVTVTLTESNAVLAPDQPVTLTATVTPVNVPPTGGEQNPSGYVLFYAETTLGTTLISGQVAVAQGPGDTGIASTVVPNLSPGVYSITAHYSGDPTFGPAVSNSLSLQAEDFTIACNATNITMVQGTTQSVTCNVASLGGLTGPIQVVCAEQNAPQTGAVSCSFSPTIVNGTGQTTLTVVTTGGNVTQTASRGKGIDGRLFLAGFGLLLAPLGLKAKRLRGRMLALALLCLGMAGAGLGCNNTINTTNQSGTPLGVHTLKITAAADVNTVTVSHYAYLTVNVTP